MKLKYTIHTIKKNGQTEIKSSQFDTFPIVIGRGGASAILLESKLVSLEHVSIQVSDNVPYVYDLDSSSGVFLNNAKIVNARLKTGDILKLSDISIAVEIENNEIHLTEERRDDLDVDPEEQANKLVTALSIESHIPTLRNLCLGFAGIVAILFFILPVIGVNKGSWSSGPISNNHKMIEQDCSACHEKAFHAVPDSKCMSCHVMTDHSPTLPRLISANEDLDISCATCHTEHNGNHHLVDQASALCSSCHGDITNINPETKLENIDSFDSHPQFKASIRKDSEGKEFARISLEDRESLTDPTPIKLNHKVHLEKGIRGPEGEVDLNCSDCHRLGKDRKVIEPISFERDCKSCHPLSFDDRLPNKEVPHGDPNLVYSYLYAEYAKLALGGGSSPKEDEEFNVRRKPGFTVERETSKVVTFTKSNISKESRSAEEQLFTKTACQLCHVSVEVSIENKDVNFDGTQSRFKLLTPEIPSKWFPASTFSHGAHDEVQCESCHNLATHSVAESTSTKDLFLPGIETCQECHSATASSGFIKSNCVMCHSYHESLTMNHNEKRSLKDIVVSLNKRK